MIVNILQWLLERIHALWPIRIVDADEQGVKFSGGKTVILLVPGLHVFIPFYEKIEKVNVKYQEIDCQVQSLETIDGVSVTLSVNAGYTITDAVKWRTEVQHFDSTAERRIRGLIAPVVLGSPWLELRDVETITQLRRRVYRDLKKFGSLCGVRFHSVAITDLTRAKPIRLYS